MSGHLVRSALARLLLLALAWWAVTEGDTSTWRYGVVGVLVATPLSVWLLPPARPPGSRRRRAVAAAGLAGWFVQRSVAGGVDVARRALTRPVDLRPGVVVHRLGLPPGVPRVLLADLLSLMPGTLTIELDDDVLVAHVLDTRLPVAQQLAELERRIAAVVGAPGG